MINSISSEYVYVDENETCLIEMEAVSADDDNDDDDDDCVRQRR